MRGAAEAGGECGGAGRLDQAGPPGGGEEQSHHPRAAPLPGAPGPELAPPPHVTLISPSHPSLQNL